VTSPSHVGRVPHGQARDPWLEASNLFMPLVRSGVENVWMGNDHLVGWRCTRFSGLRLSMISGHSIEVYT
jgi:hypothetical protein